MLRSFLPCGSYQNNTTENRWQVSNQEEQVKCDCSVQLFA